MVTTESSSARMTFDPSMTILGPPLGCGRSAPIWSVYPWALGTDPGRRASTGLLGCAFGAEPDHRHVAHIGHETKPLPDGLRDRGGDLLIELKRAAARAALEMTMGGLGQDVEFLSSVR